MEVFNKQFTIETKVLSAVRNRPLYGGPWGSSTVETKNNGENLTLLHRIFKEKPYGGKYLSAYIREYPLGDLKIFICTNYSV